MKAQEVLHRYAEGDRDFRNANLRGASFEGKDLSGADFTGADLCSANFTNATLRRANFAQAQAGIQRRWRAMQVLLLVVLSGIAGIFLGIVDALATALFDGSNDGLIAGSIYVLLMMVVYVAISLQGFTVRSFATIISAYALVVLLIFASADVFAIPLAESLVFAFASSIVGAFLVSSAVGAIGAFVVSGMDSFAISVAIAFIVVFSMAAAFAVSGANAFAFAVSAAIAFSSLLLVLSVGWRVRRESNKVFWVRVLGARLASLGGTTFSGADLTKANFSKAQLNHANFSGSPDRDTKLTHARWQGAYRLNRVRWGTAILRDRRVRNLLVMPEQGYKQDFTNADFRGANLNGVTLEGATLRRADLSNATLKKTVLKDAILTGAQAGGADFTEACLTGATLDSWHIDKSTTLTNVDCQYVFLSDKPSKRVGRERFPREPKEMFQPGDFEKIFRKLANAANDGERPTPGEGSGQGSDDLSTAIAPVPSIEFSPSAAFSSSVGTLRETLSNGSQSNFKTLLARLKAAIEAEPGFNDEDRMAALKVVKEISAASQSPQTRESEQSVKQMLASLEKSLLGDRGALN